MKFQWRSMEYKTKLMILCSAANFINAADRVIMPLAIVPMSKQFRWSLTQQGAILSSFAFGYFASQIAGANAANKYGGPKVLLIAVFLWSFSTLLTVFFAQYFPLLILCRIILGMGEGLGLPTIFYMYAEHIPPDLRSRAFGYMLAAGSAGQTIASLVVPHIDWTLAFELLGGFGILWVFCWKMLKHRNLAPDEEQHLVIEEKEETQSVLHRKWFVHWPFWAIYIAHFSMNWSNYIIMQWLPTYLHKTLGVNTKILSITAVPYIVSSVAGIFWGHLADQMISLGRSILSVRRSMTIVGLLGPGICLIVFPEVSSVVFALLIISIAQGFCAANSAGHLSNHADVASTHAGVTFAISNTIATIPGVLCGPLTAILVNSSNGRWFPVFLLAGMINVTASIIYYTQSAASTVL